MEVTRRVKIQSEAIINETIEIAIIETMWTQAEV